MVAFVVTVQVWIVQLHQPVWTAIMWLIAFAAFGSYLEWNDHRHGRR